MVYICLSNQTVADDRNGKRKHLISIRIIICLNGIAKILPTRGKCNNKKEI